MSTDADSVPARKPRSSNAPAPSKKKKKKGVKPKIMRPLTEKEINVPDMPTLIMIAVLAALTLTLWVFAHAGCNYHPPRETRRPREVTTAELTKEPKDAAIEFQQRLITLNYKGALEIAGGSLIEDVKKAQAACGADCLAKKTGLTQAITSAVVVERSPMHAKVRVTTYHLPAGDQSFLALVERDSSGWKVTAHIPDAQGASLPSPNGAPSPINTPGQPIDAAPAGSANPHAIRLVPAPAGSASGQPLRLIPAPAPSGH